ncbi:MAG: DUF3015 domain-containing protein [Gammaproteobacteria bacterium]|nr:DUF3015 domain-containing protein [Gammaproteobacteria bacterium]
MKKIALTLATMALTLSSIPAMAAETGGGCGVGKVLLEGQKGVGANVGASILNQVLLPQSSSMTSGIMGCDTTQVVKNGHDRETFATANRDELSVEMAQGQGNHLASLADIMGISEQHRADFYSLTQKKYESLNGSDSAMMLGALDSAMSSHPALSVYVR